jgi:predicted aldo/keto reductase-like oxidoreductase
MNYIDTSPCYGGSEDVIGRAFKENPGLRQKVIVATKWDPGPKTPKERMLESLDESLRRMGTDHVDVMQVHWLGGFHVRDDNGFNRLDNPELYLAMEAAKKAGKVRFFGVTSHDGNRGKILEYAVDKGSFDMMLVKVNVLDFDEAGMPSLLAKANAKNVGVVVMKSQPGGGLVPKGFEKSRWNVFQANLRWALGLDVACVVHSGIGSDEKIQDLAASAVSEPLTREERELLDGYAAALSPDYCRGCAAGEACHAACPEGVAIAPVIQFAMYAQQYGWPEYARELYQGLDPERRWSEACLSCSACTEACPYGVDAASRVRSAKSLLG